MDYKEPTYNKGEYKYPGWAIGIGWIIASCSILPIPIFAVIAVIKAKGSNIWEVSKSDLSFCIFHVLLKLAILFIIDFRLDLL